MPWHEREYYRESGFGGGTLGRLSGHSVVTWLLGLNAAVFVLDAILAAGTRTQFSLANWGYYSVTTVFQEFQLWRLVTYQFLHAGLFHLLFNMIALYFFGPLLEQWWGSRRFLAFYLLCGISGALVMTVLSFVPGLLGAGPGTPLVGASGSIYGILIGAAVLFPNQRVMLLIPPIPMSMRTLAIVLMVIVTLSLIAGSNAGGQAAHLGGALLGFVLVKNPRWLDWADRLGGGRLSVADMKLKHQQRQAQRRREKQAAEEAEVDRILDKVKNQGLQSLTGREKKILNRATERHRGGR